MTTRLSVARALVEFSEKLKIQNCFSVNGGMAMFLNYELAQSKVIDVTYVHHEQAAICAAEGYSKTLNFKIPGLACITAGPGVSNSITGLLSSYGDSTPILILAGQIKTSDIDVWGTRTHGVQEIDSKSIISPAVKLFLRIEPSIICEQLQLIYKALIEGRPGPIFIEVPLDVQNNEIEISWNEIFSSEETIHYELTDQNLNLLKNFISSAHKVGVYLGNGIRISNSEIRGLMEVTEKFNIPVFTSWISADMIDYYQKNNFHSPGSLAPIYSNQTIQACDLVIFIGARLDLATTAYNRDKFGALKRRIIFDVDEKELSKFGAKNDDLLIRYDLRNGLDFLESELRNVNQDILWFHECLSMKEKYLELESLKLKDDNLEVRHLAQMSHDSFESGVIALSSSGYAIEGFLRFFRSNGRVRLFCGAALGSMGQGLANGIGAAKAKQENEKLWIVESDGGLWMSIHEIATLKYINPKNTTLFILNNDGYGSIKNSQIRHFNYFAGCDEESGLLIPDYEKIAKVFSINYMKIQNIMDLKKYFEIGESSELTIVDFIIPLQENRGPSLKTIFIDNKPVTQDLAQIDW